MSCARPSWSIQRRGSRTPCARRWSTISAPGATCVGFCAAGRPRAGTMESMRDVLSRITTPTATAGANTATSSSRSCPTCGGAGWLRLEGDLDDPRLGQTVPFACKAKELEEKKMRVLVEHSNLQALRDRTFAAFRPQEHQQHAYDRARE